MRTLTIELRWPPCVRMIPGKALTLQGVELDPPPLLVAACAAKARAEAARRGWQTRKNKQAFDKEWNAVIESIKGIIKPEDAN